MDRVAVLASGGLDSAILVAELARSALIHPLYVNAGLVWEREEREVEEGNCSGRSAATPAETKRLNRANERA